MSLFMPNETNETSHGSKILVKKKEKVREKNINMMLIECKIMGTITAVICSLKITIDHHTLPTNRD